MDTQSMHGIVVAWERHPTNDQSGGNLKQPRQSRSAVEAYDAS